MTTPLSGDVIPPSHSVNVDPASRLEQGKRELRAALDTLRREISEQPWGAADTQLRLPTRSTRSYSGKADEYRL